jgi:dihydroorotase
MTMEVVIEGNAFIDGDLNKCAIGIEEGRIKSIKKILKGDKHYDFGDKLILPAGIDAHVHFRDPGMTHKEDFKSGTQSAAYGGISCVLDMPNTIPPITNITNFEDKSRICSSKAFVDFGLYAGVSLNRDIEKFANKAIAYKIYLATTTGEMLIGDYEALGGIFTAIGKTQKPVCVHCEDERLINKASKPKSLKEHLKNRPNLSEESGIKKVIDKKNDAKVHVCHVTTSEGVKLLENTEITSEVTPHHLFLNTNFDIGVLGKVNPPLRQPKDQEALWNALNQGAIDIIASDHAPHTLDEKEHFENAPSGIPGVETMLPLMLSLVKHNKFQLARLINAVSERPGEIFQLNKGKLEVGCDGDIIIVDMRKEAEISLDNLHSKAGWTPYEGFSAVFPRFTFVRGEVVIEDWELTGEMGFGRMVSGRQIEREKED